jgi:hypothetical protein
MEEVLPDVTPGPRRPRSQRRAATSSRKDGCGNRSLLGKAARTVCPIRAARSLSLP